MLCLEDEGGKEGRGGLVKAGHTEVTTLLILDNQDVMEVASLLLEPLDDQIHVNAPLTGHARLPTKVESELFHHRGRSGGSGHGGGDGGSAEA